jgi:transcription antitermination factor NusG
MENNTSSIVKDILNKNLSDAKENIKQALYSKARDQIADRKEEVAQSLYKEETELDEAAAKVGDWVKVIIDDPQWDGRVGQITEINPIGGYSGYSVHLFDDDTTLTVDLDEVVVLKGSRLRYYEKMYEEKELNEGK